MMMRYAPEKAAAAEDFSKEDDSKNWKENDIAKLGKDKNEYHFVFVKNFAKTTTMQQLHLHFQGCGFIEDIYMPKRSRYGFVYFNREASVTAALLLHGSMMGEHQIIVRRGVLGGPNA